MDDAGLLHSSTSFWIVTTLTVVVVTYVVRRLRFDWVVVGIVIAGILLCANYLAYTSVSERNYDGPAQIQYSQVIAQELRLPDVWECAPCGHPPLYYALAAFWSKAVLAGGWIPLELGLQWLSLLSFFGFVVFALLILRSCTRRPATLWLATALIVFWPSSIINSVRVHNDALASLLMLAAMYFTAEWDRKGRSRDFHAALVAVALALFTKASGYTVAATLVVITVLRLRSHGFHREGIQRSVTAVTVLASAAVLAVALRESRRVVTICQKVLGHACDGRYVPAVPDTPGRFIQFDLSEFVLRAQTVPADPFLNRLAKSSLFGVMTLGPEFSSERQKMLAMLMSVLLLVMLLVCMVALRFLGRASWRASRAYLGAVVTMFAFLIAFRLRAPNEFHEDFRHIFPVLVPFCLGYAACVERLLRYSKRLHQAGVVVGLLMVAASISFYVRIP